ncbi:MAG: non-homologous end-joining DNA ligase [Acidimicrobiia bacterium]|nr:non-homologous end-joining DNA ligase [Acidimicrobiia bacterium]
MLATPYPQPFIDADWVFELKWDGIRGMLTAGPGHALTITSRAGNSLTDRYPDLHHLALPEPTVLDGEIVAFDEAGRPSFEALQQRMGRSGDNATGVVGVSYVVFDVLFCGHDVTNEPWSDRRSRLEALELPDPYVVSSVVPEDPTGLWSLVEERGIEGIVAKRRSSIYRPGVRSAEWRKITRFRQVRAVVGGFLPGDRSRSDSFGSLLVGLWADDGLRWIGAVGTGFNQQQLRAIRAALDEMTIDDSPFLDAAAIPRGAVWVAPQLVTMIQYKEFTSAGRLRAPSFKGFTDDDVRAITWEQEGPNAPG